MSCSIFYSCFCSLIFSAKSNPSPRDPPQLSPQTAVGTASHLLPVPTLSARSGGEEEVSFWLLQLFQLFSAAPDFFIEKVKVTKHSCHQPHSVPWLKLKRSHTSSPYQHWLLLRGRKFSICPSLLHCFQASHNFFKWKVSRPPCHQLQLSLCTSVGLATHLL